MELKQFEETLKNNNALRLNEELLLFNDLELYNLNTDESIIYENLEQLYDSTIEGINFKDFIKKDFVVRFTCAQVNADHKVRYR